MHKLKCIIVEDELPSAQEMQFILSQYEFIELKGVAQDGESGYNLIELEQPDVVFLDINIPGVSGLEVARKVKEFNKDIDIVFVTAYEQHALKAFEIEALDYVLKPFDEDRFERILHRLEEKKMVRDNKATIEVTITEMMSKLVKKEKPLNKIPCDHNGKIILVDVDEIYYCYIEDEKTFIKLKDKSYFTSHSLGEIEEKTDFLRVHRSYLVNLNQIKELYSWFNGTYKLIMDDNDKSEVPVSRSNVRRLKEVLDI